MTKQEILTHIDHTQLKAFCTWEDIKKLCDEAIKYNTASVCIPPSYIERIKETYGDKINICTVIGFPLGYNTTEIKALKEAAGDKILKVIIETCYLTDDEKVKLCQCVTNAKADYIKTSTGFGTGGATIEDIRLFAQNIGPDVKMKAAGGVKSREDLEIFLEAGCDRIGTSSAVKMLEEN